MTTVLLSALLTNNRKKTGHFLQENRQVGLNSNSLHPEDGLSGFLLSDSILSREMRVPLLFQPNCLSVCLPSVGGVVQCVVGGIAW